MERWIKTKFAIYNVSHIVRIYCENGELRVDFSRIGNGSEYMGMVGKDDYDRLCDWLINGDTPVFVVN